MYTITQYLLPEWISIFFLFVIPLPFILIAMFVRREARKLPVLSAFPTVIVFFVLYLAYIIFASYKGWFNLVSLPPRIILLTTIPYIFLLFGILIHTKIYKIIVKNAAIEDLVKLHIFRLIGVFFIILAYHRSLPHYFAFIAGTGDIITALTSIYVVKAIQNKKKYAKKITYIWNIFGVTDILFTIIAANMLTKISIDTGTMGVDTLATFPFCIIPAFAPPTILFLHWTIFKKLKCFSV